MLKRHPLLAVSIVQRFGNLLFSSVFVVTLWLIAVDNHNGLSLVNSVYAHDFGGGGSGVNAKDSDPEDAPPCDPSAGTCCEKEGVANKVLLYTGAETFRRTDMVVNGIFPIIFARKYDSRSTYDSPLGYGWSHTHNFRVYEYPDGSVILRSGCGIKTRYINTGGAFQREAGGLLANITEDNGSFTVDYLNGQRQYFDVQGRMLWWQDAAGNRLEYTYNPVGKVPLTGASQYSVDPSKPMVVSFYYQLTKIEEKPADGSAGNYLDLSYDPTTGRLTRIDSNDGRFVSYEHDATLGLTLGNLVKVNGLENVTSTYKYEDKDAQNVIQDYHNITYIQEGVDSAPIIEKYDDRDRVEQETVGNRVINFDYVIDLMETHTIETVLDSAAVPIHTITEKYEFDTNGYVTKYTTGEGLEIEKQRTALGLIEREEYFEIIAAVRTSIKRIDRTFYPNGRINTETARLDKGTVSTADDETVTTTRTYDDTLVATETKVWSAQPTKLFKTETIYNHDINGKPTTIQAVRRYKDNGVDYQETSFTYNSNGDVFTTSLPDGHIIENEYGAAYSGRYVTHMFHRDSGGAAMTDLEEFYEYDSKGNRTEVRNARGYSTITSYDDKNRRRVVTNAKGQVVNFVYDVNDNITHVIRDRTANNDQLDDTKLTYDNENRLVQVDRTNNTGIFVLRSTLRYDSVGNVLARGDAYGVETKLGYDMEHRLKNITDDAGNYITYTLDALGRRSKTEYFRVGGVQTYQAEAVFDDLDRQEKIIGALSQTTSFSYDASNNRITATDALSRPATQYGYDTLSRLTNILDANNKNTEHQYDDRNQLRFVTDQRGLQTQYQYNELAQLRFLISPDTGTTEYTYDLAGNRKTQKDARNITTAFGYDELNRLTSKTYPTTALNVTYGYDVGTNGIGKPTSMTDGEGSTTFEYDERGNRTKVTRYIVDIPYVTEYGYDLNNRLIKVTYFSGRSVDYVRNTLGQITTVTTTPTGGVAETVASNVNYLPFGALEDITFGNSLLMNQTYDNDYRLTGQILGSVYNRNYGYDLVNNIKNITDNISVTKNQTFNYDDLDRLDDAAGVYGIFDYTYDDVGNRRTKTVGSIPALIDCATTNHSCYNYDPVANQLDSITQAESHSFSYDANGNTKTKDTYTFTYNDLNRMAQVNDGSTTTNYAYNGIGERVKKLGTSTTLYHYDNNGNLLYETDDIGNTLVEYVWLGNQRLALINSTDSYYLHLDHLGTPQLLTDSAGVVAWQADYEPFGKASVSITTVSSNLRFQGQYFDTEIGMSYNYFRDYDPNTGRYIESDPIGLRGGINTYGYALANPLKYTDSLGLDVFVCGRPADLPFPFGMFNHEWLLTDTLERGMGAANGGVPAQNGNSDLPFTPVEVVDHKDQSLEDNARCDKVEKVDEECVNKLLKEGRSLGRFGLTNNCQSFVMSVIIQCTK